MEPLGTVDLVFFFGASALALIGFACVLAACYRSRNPRR